MKIIQHGVIPEQITPWPVGSHFGCFHCQCQFQVETGDVFRQETERSVSGKSEIWIHCPDCGSYLRFTRQNRGDILARTAVG